jgi:hypothetical protein
VNLSTGEHIQAEMEREKDAPGAQAADAQAPDAQAPDAQAPEHLKKLTKNIFSKFQELYNEVANECLNAHTREAQQQILLTKAEQDRRTLQAHVQQLQEEVQRLTQDLVTLQGLRSVEKDPFHETETTGAFTLLELSNSGGTHADTHAKKNSDRKRVRSHGRGGDNCCTRPGISANLFTPVPTTSTPAPTTSTPAPTTSTPASTTSTPAPSTTPEAGPPSVRAEAAALHATTASATSKKIKKCGLGDGNLQVSSSDLEQDKESSRKKPKRVPKVHGAGATNTDVVNAFLTVRPGLGLASWKFKDEQQFNVFTETSTQNGNAAILRSLGYTTDSDTHSYSWNPCQALWTIYALKTNWQMDRETKQMLKTKRHLANIFASTFEPTTQCVEAEAAQEDCRNLFPFFIPSAEKASGEDMCSLPPDKREKIKEINTNLASMLATGQVVQAHGWELSEKRNERVRKSLQHVPPPPPPHSSSSSFALGFSPDYWTTQMQAASSGVGNSAATNGSGF